MSRLSARAHITAAGIAVSLLMAGCVSPALDADQYQQQASGSIAASESELQTTRIVLDSALAGRMFQASADEIVSGSETALGSVASSFQAVQPPTGSDGVRTRTMRYLRSAEDAVMQARIAVRRSDALAMRLALGRVRRLLSHADSVGEQP